MKFDRSKIYEIVKNNKNIIVNIFGAFFVKGLAMLLSLFLLPAYIKFFGNSNILGVWYTILSIINWVLVFDLGIGNGLRNELPKTLSNKDYDKAKQLISSTYISSVVVVLFIGIIGTILIQTLNWNSLLNIKDFDLSIDVIRKAIQIAFVGILIQFVLKIIASVLYAIQMSSIVNLMTLISSVILFIIISIMPQNTSPTAIITISYINIIAVNLPLLVVTVIIFRGKLKNIHPSIRDWSFESAKCVLKIGVTLLWLQLVFMIVSSTNEFLISAFCSPADVVVYQVYFKIFNGVASICTLVLVPIWSAVTKAKVEHRYQWIKNIYKLLLGLSILALILELIVVIVLQNIVDLWLKQDSIKVNYFFAVIVAFYSYIFLVHNVNASIGNGMSFFKPQVVFMSIAALIDIPVAWFLVKLVGGWIGVVIANIIVLLPYEIIEPIIFMRFVNRLINNTKEIQVK